MCEGWALAYWARDHQKHWPRGGIEWERIVQATGEGKKIAKYKHAVDIESLEMSYRTEGHLIVHREPLRYYVIESEEVVGASLGEETRFVQIVRGKDGSVHGVPRTEEEIAKIWRKHQEGVPFPPQRTR